MSAISIGLGGSEISVAPDAGWSVEGEVVIERFADPGAEAARVIEVVSFWLAAHPDESIAVMVRAKHRREAVDAAVQAQGLTAEVWDFPAHRPGVVGLLVRHVGAAVRVAGEGVSGVEELFLRCAESVSGDDEALLDELSEAADSLIDLVREAPLSEVVAGIRVASDPDSPTRPGLHLLNGHLGKGQGFDRVVVLGLEDGHVPYYRAKTKQEVKDELSVLHVMASRARKSLMFTVCHDVPFRGATWVRDPSRWLASIENYTTGWIDTEELAAAE
ncbi:MAG: 3'-5' exonuclease [Ilumatobacter sp.]|uniref:3'-5' exonuclease n=1 Tax=Ilumatobacter sp. TaxID=1967498 RepID=UPI002629F4F7|nr:3'-5' exonuclease [Ilumatobacter sp.]MDJ0770968.1 3'-5' exonuclease [Ilumatobacter sp.]